jgi:tetratricopeptide (TPR) repeat protein
MAEEVTRGTTIRRFVVIERIGAGAMGVVYSAHDYTLDRKLAIKLVRGDRVPDEAQALAKLSHRNVVSIYDVGTYGDQVYIAMELVAGGTLRDRIGSADALRLMREAGAGLAAAHDAGIIHGDFKPENVLVDGSGRAVVADFGLARVAGDAERGVSPAYAAPEADRDAQSDQFSFCVTAYEALYGKRPFANDDTAGAIEPPSRRVPARIRAAIVRGLAADPAERWPSMHALVAALAPRRRTAPLVAAVAAAATLGVVATVMLRGDPEVTCGDDRASAVWSDARRELLRVRLSPKVFARVSQRLDDYTRDWSAMHLGACQATRVDGTQSEALLDLRMECLRRRLDEVDAGLDALTGIRDDVGSHAIDMTKALVPVAGCADATALQAPAPLPTDPVKRAAIDAMFARYAQGKALFVTGRDRESLAIIQPLAGEATAIGYRPLEAEALYLRGRLEYQADHAADAEVTLEAAIAAGQAGTAYDTLARAWLELVWVVGELRGRFDEAERLGSMARGAVERANNPVLAAALEDKLGVIALDRNDLPLAKTRLEHALAMREKVVGPGDLEVGASLQHLAILRSEEGDDAGALAMHRRAAAILEHELGPDHAMTGEAINGLAGAQYESGDVTGAIASWRRALDIAERGPGPHSFDAAVVRISLALGLRDIHQLGEALVQVKRGLDDFLAINGDGHVEAPGYIMNYGFILMAASRFTEAEAQMTRAIALLDKRGKPVELAQGYIALGQVRMAAGDAHAAAESFEHALALRVAGKASGEELGAARVQLAEAIKTTDPKRSHQLAAEARETATGTWRDRADALLAAK